MSSIRCRGGKIILVVEKASLQESEERRALIVVLLEWMRPPVISAVL